MAAFFMSAGVTPQQYILGERAAANLHLLILYKTRCALRSYIRILIFADLLEPAPEIILAMHNVRCKHDILGHSAVDHHPKKNPQKAMTASSSNGYRSITSNRYRSVTNQATAHISYSSTPPPTTPPQNRPTPQSQISPPTSL